jgi:hypothetical protein
MLSKEELDGTIRYSWCSEANDWKIGVPEGAMQPNEIGGLACRRFFSGQAFVGNHKA